MVSSHGVKLGIIYLPTFDVPGVHAEVGVDLHALLRSHVRGIVLDLRDNRGGLVTEAQLVASMFLRKGVIVTTRARGEPASVVRATGQVIAPTIPLVVLVNGDTASAAEIVTGALHDHHRATIVGTRTYGKGVFQEIIPLSNGGAVDITVGHYFLPDGENLGAGGLRRGPGIKPDVTVKARAEREGRPPAAGSAARSSSRGRVESRPRRLSGGARASRPFHRRPSAVRPPHRGRQDAGGRPRPRAGEGRRPRARDDQAIAARRPRGDRAPARSPRHRPRRDRGADDRSRARSLLRRGGRARGA